MLPLAKLDALPAFWPGSIDANVKAIVFRSSAEGSHPNYIVAGCLEMNVVGNNSHLAGLIDEIDTLVQLVGMSG